MKINAVDYNDSSQRKNFARSLNEIGFAILKNHIIPTDLITEAYLAWQQFFSSNDKFNYQGDVIKPQGYYHYWLESQEFRKLGLPMESFYVYSHTVFHDANKSLQDVTMRLYRKLECLASELLEWLVIESPDDITSSIRYLIDSTKLSSSLRVIHSPPMMITPGIKEDEVHIAEFRNIEHEDIDILTLLPSATEPGLQLLDNSGNWQDVNSSYGELIINSGDSLQLITNNYYKSTTHRVRNPLPDRAFNSRYSMAFFISY